MKSGKAGWRSLRRDLPPESGDVDAYVCDILKVRQLPLTNWPY